MSHIAAETLTKDYGRGSAAVRALKGVSFEIDSGEFVAVMGASGAGKSTILSILGAMNAPTSGRLLVDGIDVYALDGERRADFRREFLGFVFQSFHLVPYLSVLENVELPLTITGKNRREQRAMVLSALEQVGLADKADRLPADISGGEQERVAIARAIVNEPPILLADEPTGNLDSRTATEIMSLLKRLHRRGMTIIMVTHNAECAAMAQRSITVSDGTLAVN
ncbi:MAG: ABC transporter ATP-binding protein [Pseudomonadota bacterium]